MELLKELPIDESLTPENAAGVGYEWVQDIMYDREAPIEAMQEYVNLVEKEGYKLGQSAGFTGDYQGLYAPIKK